MAKNEKDVKQKSSYFKEMKAELKKVVWPTPKELVSNTTSVIGFVLIIAFVVFILDFCFDNLNKYGITKLQDKVRTSFQTTEDSDNTTEGEEVVEGEDSEDEDQSNIDIDETESQEAIQSQDSDEQTNTENSSNESNE